VATRSCYEAGGCTRLPGRFLVPHYACSEERRFRAPSCWWRAASLLALFRGGRASTGRMLEPDNTIRACAPLMRYPLMPGDRKDELSLGGGEGRLFSRAAETDAVYNPAGCRARLPRCGWAFKEPAEGIGIAVWREKVNGAGCICA